MRPFSLFEFDGRRWFGREIKEHAVDASDLIDDPIGNKGEKLIWKSGWFGGHEVIGVDGAEDDGVVIGTLIAFDANALHVRESGEILGRFDLALGNFLS